MQGVPQGVQPPRVTALSAETLQLSGTVPRRPNSVIKEYQLWQVGTGLIYTDTGDKRQHTVTGKKKKKKRRRTYQKRLSLWLGGQSFQGCGLTYEVTSKGHVPLTYGQIPLTHANRGAHTGSNKPQQQISSEIIYSWL